MKKFFLWQKGKDIEAVPKDAEIVHMIIYPTLNNMRALLERCPNLKTVEVIPSNRWIIEKSHRNLMESHGVRIVFSRIRTEVNYDQIDFHSSEPFYKMKRDFYMNPGVKAEARLEELKKYGLEEVKLLERYLCIKGEPHISILRLAEENGYKLRRLNDDFSALLLYLGAPREIIKIDRIVISRAKLLKKRVEKIRKYEKDIESLKKYEKYQKLPRGLKPDCWDTFSKLTELDHHNPERLKALRHANPDQYQSVVMYFGLSGEHRTLERIGEYLGITKERVRQKRNKGLAYLRC